jgi:hypothetical protein
MMAKFEFGPLPVDRRKVRAEISPCKPDGAGDRSAGLDTPTVLEMLLGDRNPATESAEKVGALPGKPRRLGDCAHGYLDGDGNRAAVARSVFVVRAARRTSRTRKKSAQRVVAAPTTYVLL